jgi:hypothetical protein
MPMEFLHGRPLSPEELEMIRQQIEEGSDNIADVDDEIRGIVARNWSHCARSFRRLTRRKARSSPSVIPGILPTGPHLRLCLEA